MRLLLKSLRIAAAAAVVIAVLLLAWQCVDIYVQGSGQANLDENGLYISPVYSPEDVALRLGRLALPLALCAAAAVLSLLAHAAVGFRPEAPRGLSAENRLRLVKARVEALPEAALKEERRRKALGLGFGIPMGLLGLLCLVYLLDGRNFPLWSSAAPDAVMARLLLHILPPCLLALLLGMALSCLRRRSMERELELLRPLPKREAPAAAPAAGEPKRLRALLLGLALVFILLGVMNGGARDVLYKAINICTECIGLG